jgi:hypothetical protein
MGWTTKGSEFESRMRERNFTSPCRARIFTSPCRPDRLWGPPNLLANGYCGIFLRGKATVAWRWPLTSSWYRGQENVDLYIHSPIRLHGVVLNYLSTGATLPFTYLFQWYTELRLLIYWKNPEQFDRTIRLGRENADKGKNAARPHDDHQTNLLHTHSSLPKEKEKNNKKRKVLCDNVNRRGKLEGLEVDRRTILSRIKWR